MRHYLWELLFTIEKNKMFSSIKKSFMLTFPIVLIGTAAVLINSILLPVIESFLPFLLYELISNFCTTINGATVGCLALYIAIAAGYYYAQACDIKNVLLRLMATLTGVICFFILIGGITSSAFSSYMGVIGVFPAIVVELTAVSSFLAITRFLTRNHQKSSLGVDDNLKVSLISILPTLLTVFSCMTIQYIATTVLHVGDLYANLSSFFTLIFNVDSSSLWIGTLFTTIVSFLWAFGVHGGNVMDPISVELLVPMIEDAGSIISKSFLDIFTLMGGSGTSICLLLALFLVSRSNSTRRIARSAAPMIIFNINELLVFGLPIILNPIMMLPFIIVPLVALAIAYIATIIGFIPVITESISWATPIFFSGYKATGSINGIIVQLIILICGTLIYIPFVKLLDKFYDEREARILTKLITLFQSYEETGVFHPMLTRTDSLGQTARMIAYQLRLDVEADCIEFFYQPQMNENDCIVGAEALLRWKYQGQFIYPPLVIAIAREEGVLNRLTLQSTEKACDTINDITKITKQPFHIAINMSASQLDDTALINNLISIAKRKNTLNHLHFELTEETSLNGFRNIYDNIDKLCSQGIILAIDDFGMGQTSINYLREHTFEYVKIDGSLVKHILTNPRCQQIITSIVELGHSLNYNVIAEYVSSIEIKEKLMEMDCHLFQGFYYSPAIPKEAFIQYCLDTIDNSTIEAH